ncbi:MAG: class I SAM-dependent methyltransferase [Actinomycetota bacterium]|nr:class I SAM-dependent methyltransferase [Actinomycetota bacterium]
MPDVGNLQHPWFARLYLRLSTTADRSGAADHRTRLLAGLSGRVIEVGAGNGLNFKHYPHAVVEVLAVEPDDVLRAHAESAARNASIPIRVVAGHADALPADDASCDAAVASLVLCSVPDPASALAELCRAVRPGGELRFYEHVRSGRRWVGRAQDLIIPLWSRVAGGCHPNRDTLTAIRAAGFEVSEVHQITFGLQHVLGRATRQ